MWQILAKQLLKELGRQAAGSFFNAELNKSEAYADRIKRDFNLNEWADAWKLYDSDRPYWEDYYRQQLGKAPVRKLVRVTSPGNANSGPEGTTAASTGANSAAPNWPTPSTQMSLGAANGNLPPPNVSNASAPPIQFLPQVSQSLPNGFPGWSSVTGIAPPVSTQPDDSNKPGGLLGRLIEHVQNYPNDY